VSSIEVRQFRRADREQLTALVNAHAAAVVPGASVSVNAVLSQLERDPGEFVVDPWVRERLTFVAEQRSRLVAAAHLLRYGDEPQVGESYRSVGELRWFLCWPPAPYWRDSEEAGDALLAACVAQLDRWGVARQYADGTLPVPGVYGVPEQWPHVRAAYGRAGFAAGGRVELVYLVDVEQLAARDVPELPGVELRRSLGINGTRLAAVCAGETVGFVEVDSNLEEAVRVSRLGAWADVGNLWLADGERLEALGGWLLAQAAAWLRLAGVRRLLDYTTPDERERIAFLEAAGFRLLTRTERGWGRTRIDSA
jgi:GNAT superfamily N-acetyltransferase